jgi:hypothetical protein
MVRNTIEYSWNRSFDALSNYVYAFAYLTRQRKVNRMRKCANIALELTGACQELCVKAFDHTGTLPVNLIAS